MMDPNLEKICNSCIHLIRQGKFAKAKAYAKDYLVNILGLQQMPQIDREMDGFVAHIHSLSKAEQPN